MLNSDAGTAEDDNPWANYHEKKKAPVEEVCSIHGEACPTGICREGSEIKRWKRSQEQREREASIASLAGGKGKTKKKGKNGRSKAGSVKADSDTMWRNETESESRIVVSDDGWQTTGNYSSHPADDIVVLTPSFIGDPFI